MDSLICSKLEMGVVAQCELQFEVHEKFGCEVEGVGWGSGGVAEPSPLACASFESIIAIENTWEWVEGMGRHPYSVPGLCWAGKMEFGKVGSFGPSSLITSL
ncbi:hypothetical protein Tco_0740109 [Tanacetum coccineum]